MEENKVFTEKKTRAPEKLNEYIRIGSAGGFLLIIGLILLAVGLIVWGFVGRIPVTSTIEGVVVNDPEGFRTCLCLVDVNGSTGLIPEGTPAIVRTIDGKTCNGTVAFMANIAMSEEELRTTFSTEVNPYAYTLSEWILNNLIGDSDYLYAVYIKTEEDLAAYWNQMTEVTIIHSEVQPISFLLRH